MNADLTFFSEDGTVTREARQRRTEAVKVGRALARASDPDTSKQAAAKQWGGIPAAIMELFDTFDIGALTDDDIAERLSWAHGPTVKSARSRLTKAGLLTDSGVRRASLTGSEMICWRRAR